MSAHRPSAASDHSGDATDKVEPLAYGMEDAAEALGVSVPTLFRWKKAGLFRTTKVGGRTLVRRVELERMLEAGEEAPRAT